MSRPILSRPRTRVYGCNYDKGESYYKPMVDHLDRKYSARPLFSEPRTSFADEIAARRSDIGTRDLAGTRHGALGRELDLEFEPRARKLSPLKDSLFEDAEDTVYDVRGQRTSRHHRLSEDFANEVAATTRRLKARVSAIDSEFESESKARTARIDSEFADMVGKSTARSAREEADAAFKRRPKFLSEEADSGAEKSHLTRWSKVADSSDSLEDMANSAVNRALRSKARLNDLESEMEEMAEKQARRDRRVAALRALASESAEENLLASQASKMSLRSERSEKHVTF